MIYTVKYRLKGRWFWRTVKNVKGDLIAPDISCLMRVLILKDESRIEIPIEGTEFSFSNGRFIVIKKNSEKEAGQKLQLETEV